MGFMLLKNFCLVFLLLSASFLSTSFAGRRSKFVDKSAYQIDTTYEESSNKDEASMFHERVLRANTKDYGNYDPAPSLVRPPFKLIPN
ncbi:protein CASPARIAN STRIP INTEGRITY FACTOR 1 [Jatropha curcas]|uniref:protein CASPARIAN STRIP INTEGRITY FACTOR 1 n=1 Tax=Jatropha curcas TaxID=180498 RepID=UPI0005FAD538|nr:protein CASPARIAN STRIP INTEGRITY FACTOR 1 [Jatropha curcas]